MFLAALTLHSSKALRPWIYSSRNFIQLTQVIPERSFVQSSKSIRSKLEYNCPNSYNPAPRTISLSSMTNVSWIRKYSSDVTTDDAKQQKVGYFNSLFNVWRTPAPALITGLTGLIPFIAAPSYLYFYATSFHPFLISAQLAYGAVILSFVGGLRWGFVIPYRQGSTHLVTWKSIIQSIVPPLIAWGGLLIPDLTGGLLAVSTGLLLALYNDLRLFGDYPKWMMGLRCLLTTVAIATLLISVVLVEENRMNGGRIRNKLLDKDIE